MKTINNLQETYLSLLKKGKNKEMLPYLEKALEECDKKDLTKKKIEVLNDYSGALRNSGNLKESIEASKESLRLYHSLYKGRPDEAYVNILINLANSYRENKEYERAQTYFSLAEKLALDYPYSLASLYNNWALLFLDLKDLDQALTCEKKSLAILKDLGSPVQYAIGLNNLSDIYYEKKDEKKSRSSLEEARDLMQEILNPDHPLYLSVVDKLNKRFEKNDLEKILYQLEKDYGRDSKLYRKLEAMLEGHKEEKLSGLDQAEEFFKKEVLPFFERDLNHLLAYSCFGLVGMGSECLGYDDDISRDHDFEKRCQVFLPRDKYEIYKDEIEKKAEGLSGKLEVESIEGFYSYFTLWEKGPESYDNYLRLPQDFLLVASNGRVFLDGYGEFSRIRKKIQAYYPEDVRLKKMAYCLNYMAQSGQYNYQRCLDRFDFLGASQALGQYMNYYIEFCHLANKKYLPYYKWHKRSLMDLEGLGKDSWEDLEILACLDHKKESGLAKKIIESQVGEILSFLKEENLSSSPVDFLTYQAEELIKNIEDDRLRRESSWVL